MQASIEWVCEHPGVLWVHPPGSRQQLGGPYTWSCTVVRDGDMAELKGTSRALTLAEWRAVLVALREAGFSSRRHEQRNVRHARVVRRAIYTRNA
jgi:hypothetical protein